MNSAAGHATAGESAMALTHWMSDPVVLAVTAAFFGLLFVSAAWHKLRAIDDFEQTLAAYRLLPPRTVPAAARTILAIELVVVPLLLFATTRPLGFVLSALLLTIYAVAIAVNLGRDRRSIDCGCGAQAQPLSWPLVARNFCLAAIASASVALSMQWSATFSPSVRTFDWLDYVSFVAASLALFGLYSVANNLHAQAARMTSRDSNMHKTMDRDHALSHSIERT